ncbi:MAG: apolipoprotein N-acyltransferase [Mesorhizobium sp.]|nr:apolipoprotein N-acyltransferase [Mesorhizobium sp.]MBL8579836.1 apolipoprotein N-acyltransferase [Mesorhizobium sp.]
MERLAGRIILLWGWRRLSVAFLAGALLVLTQAPYDFFAAGFISFPVLVWLLDGITGGASARPLKRLRPAFATGWWFGFGYFLAGLWWIGGAVLVEADSFAWALPFAVVGIPLLMAFYYGFAAMLARLLWSNGLGRIAALAFAFGLAEWLRGFLFTGFPWNSVGFAAMPTPLLMQSVAITGVVGMNALAVFVFAMPALLAGGHGRRAGLIAASLLVVAHIGFGAARLNAPEQPASSTLAVRIVQPSIDPAEKWDESVRDRIFATTLDLSTRATTEGQPAPTLIVWPETSVPFLFTERPEALAAIGEMLKPGQMLLAGVIREEETGGAAPFDYNSIVAINDAGEIVGAVDKVHLVPFGEYIPFADLAKRFGLTQLVAGPMNFTAGSQRRPLQLPGGVAAAAFVCYEIIFPDMVGVDVASSRLIVNLTNDAWFGDTPGPYQHFRQAQIRAVENGLPVLRAANNGISGVIDARGRVIDALALNVRESLDVQISLPDAPWAFAPHQRTVGYVIVGFFALMALGGLAMERRRTN